MSVYERLSMVVSLTLIGLALYFVIDLPTHTLTVPLPGAAVTVAASTRLLMGMLLGGLAFSGAGAVLHADAHRRIRYTVPFWANATLLVILAMMTLGRLGSVGSWALGLLATGGLLWFTLLAEYRALHTPPPGAATARLWSQGMSYALLLAYALLLYQTPTAEWVRWLGIGGLGWLLAASIFKLYPASEGGSRSGGWVVGLALAQLSWVLSYWPLGATGTALLIMLAFYALCGATVAGRRGRLSGRTLAEYGAVAALGIGIALWMGG